MNITQDILLTGQIAAAFTAILTLGGLVIKFLVVKPIKSYIDQKTQPIQPTANGGLSLPDAIKHLQEIQYSLGHIEARLEKLEQKTQ